VQAVPVAESARLPFARVRWPIRIALGLLTLVTGLVILLLASSYLFNLATDGEGTPVTELWHGRFVTADGVLTAYREWGSHGSPIVLVGGFLEPSFVWRDVGPRLARAGHRVYALDLDGFGYSKRRGPWTLKEWADQTEGFMRALWIHRPAVVGHSLGAAVAIELARRGLAARTVLVDGDALTTGGPPRFVSDLLARSPLVTSALRLSVDWDWPASLVIANAYGPNHPKIDHTEVEDWTDQLRADGADHAINRIVAHGIQGFSRAQLQAVRTDATVVWGSEDSVDSVSAGRQTAGDLHARFVLVPGAGHLALLTDPAAVARAIGG
jgi:pimeloyl-ACP methyl ester carboxylesterase